jgi:hypothetical protein
VGVLEGQNQANVNNRKPLNRNVVDGSTIWFYLVIADSERNMPGIEPVSHIGILNMCLTESNKNQLNLINSQYAGNYEIAK